MIYSLTLDNVQTDVRGAGVESGEKEHSKCTFQTDIRNQDRTFAGGNSRDATRTILMIHKAASTPTDHPGHATLTLFPVIRLRINPFERM
jgi:hypothetical protein